MSLPTAEGGLVAQPEGTSLLALAGPTTSSYNLSVTDPTWQASMTPTVQPLDFARSSPGVGLLPNGYFVVYGGTQNGFATSAVTQYDPNTVTVPDGATNQTRSLHAMNMPRALLGSATDPSTHFDYAIGGQNNNGTPMATMEAYNPTTNTWAYLASLPQTLYSESALSDGAGHIYTFGGVGADGAITSNVYRYTSATNTWDQVASLQVGVRDSAAVLGPNGAIYVLGGVTAAGTTATVESYSPATNAWTLQTSLPQAVSSAAAVVDSLGRIEILGGYDASGAATTSIFISQKLTQADLAPTITSTPARSVVVNATYRYQVLSTANPQATYTLTGPAGMTIDANTGLVSWAPSYATEGVYNVTVVAGNSVGQASQTFSVAVQPETPTGLTGAGAATNAITFSWNATADPNVTGYNIYRRTFLHDPRGSGGTYHYSLVAANVAANSVTISGTSVGGTYLISAVNSAGVESARTPVVSVATLSAPSLWGAMTTGGAVISSLNLDVGQTGQIYLLAYGNEAPTFSLVDGPGTEVSVDSTTGLVTFTPSPADIGSATFTFAATNSVGTSTNTFTFIVSALNPTISVSGGPFTYDGNVHAAGAGAVGADGLTPVNGNFDFTYDDGVNPPTATAPTAAGTYAVTATFTSADPYYANATVTGSLTIDPATPTITVSSGPFDFDGNPHEATATALGVDGATPVDGSFQITYDGDPNPPTGPGLYIVTADFFSNDPNYASATVTANLIINSPGPATPSLSLVDGSTTYDGSAHADSASAVGLDGVTPVNGAFIITYNGSTAAPTNAGVYDVLATFISSDVDYGNATTTGTLTIDAATPTLVVDQTPFYYDGTGHSALVTALGVDQATAVDGTFSVTYNGSSTPPVNAGLYDVTVAFDSDDPNYGSTSITSSITILPATPSVGLLNGEWYFTYNGAPRSVAGSAVGIDGVTPIDGSFTYDYYNEYGSNTMLFGPPLDGPPTDVGYYTFTEHFTSQDPNYADGTFSWYLRIDPAEATVDVSGGPYTYNGAAQGASVTAYGVDGVTPLVGTTAVTYNGSTTVPSLAGTYAVHASFTSSDGNYYSAEGDGTLVINKVTPAFSSLASPTLNVGAASVTVSGHIGVGSAAPGGDAVTIVLNGVTQSVAINSSGNFTTSFNIQGLAAGSYAITYEFLGDATRFNAAGTNGFASGTLTVRSAPTILTSPSSQTVVSGSSVTFSASASGYPTPTVQWQQSTNGTTYTNISGATSAAYTIGAATAGQNGYRYRAVFTNSAGAATTASATLTVQYAPSVTTSPRAVTVNAGQGATFTAAASGNPAPTVQWQVSANGGGSFADIAGATSTTLTLAATTASQNGSVYRAVFTNSVGSATTAGATLTVRYAPVVSSSPSNQTTTAGHSVTFTAAAAGNPTPTIQWQVSTNGGSSYANISGATSANYTIGSPTAAQNGYRYRAVFTNSLGTATTTAAILTVQFAPTITANPSSQTSTAGGSVTFTAAANGNPAPTVQWQVSTDGGLTYTNISGAISATLTLTGVTAGQSGYRYRAVFTNPLGTAITTAATLTVI